MISEASSNEFFLISMFAEREREAKHRTADIAQKLSVDIEQLAEETGRRISQIVSESFLVVSEF